MIAEFVEARERHCGQMARQLRAGHRDILLGMGVRIHRELRDSFDASAWRRALIVDGRLNALTGVTGSIASADGMIWLALANEAEAHPFVVARLAMRELRDIMTVKRHLTTIVLRKDRASVRFAYFLGFRVEQSMVVHGADAMIMAYDAPMRRAA